MVASRSGGFGGFGGFGGMWLPGIRQVWMICLGFVFYVSELALPVTRWVEGFVVAGRSGGFGGFGGFQYVPRCYPLILCLQKLAL